MRDEYLKQGSVLLSRTTLHTRRSQLHYLHKPKGFLLEEVNTQADNYSKENNAKDNNNDG